MVCETLIFISECARTRDWASVVLPAPEGAEITIRRPVAEDPMKSLLPAEVTQTIGKTLQALPLRRSPIDELHHFFETCLVHHKIDNPAERLVNWLEQLENLPGTNAESTGPTK